MNLKSTLAFYDQKTAAKSYEVSDLFVKPLFSLLYGNITLPESDHDIVQYQVTQ